MRSISLRFAVALAFMSLAASAWARTDRATIDFDHTVHVGSATLEPGSYNIRAEENGTQIAIEKNGKLIAEAPCHWFQLSEKSPDDEAVIDSDTVQEIHFAGRATAVRLD